MEATAIWEQSYQLLLNIDETRSPLAKVYLDYLVPVSVSEEQFVFAIRLLQAKVWIEDRYIPYIRDAIAVITGKSLSITIILDETLDGSYPKSQQPLSVSKDESSFSPPSSRGSQSTSHQSYSPSSPSFTHTVPQGSFQSTQQFAAVITEAPPVSSSSQSSSKSTGLSSVFAPDENSQNIPLKEEGSRFSFSNYVMGDSNKFACNASLGVAERPGLYFNPLFIYGRSGLGKTHLLLAIKNYINAYLPDKRVVYAPTTEFVNDFTNAMAGDRDLTSFKRKYHTCDVLLIDDVQNLEGKEGTTDALFEIFNMFIDQKKQIVLSADRSPVQIKIDERFTSRFSQGITADIQPPNYEMKSAILKNYKRYYCEFLNIPEVDFSDDAIQRIVELSGSNIRELEGAITNLIVFVSYRPDNQRMTPVTCDDVENVLGKSFFHKNTRRIDISMVMSAVESYFNVTHAELLSDKRSKNISHPRQVAMYLIRRYTDMSYPEIGDSFNKDHTTVMYADKNIQSKMVEEVSVKAEIERISEILTS